MKNILQKIFSLFQKQSKEVEDEIDLIDHVQHDPDLAPSQKFQLKQGEFGPIEEHEENVPNNKK